MAKSSVAQLGTGKTVLDTMSRTQIVIQFYKFSLLGNFLTKKRFKKMPRKKSGPPCDQILPYLNEDVSLTWKNVIICIFEHTL